MNSQIKKIISILILSVVFLFLGYYVNRNRNIFQNLIHVDLTIVSLLIGLFLITTLSNGLINRYVLKPFNISLDFKEWFGLAITTSFYNIITPFKGGMLSKAAYLKTKHKFSYTNFLASMLGVYVVQFWIVGLIGLIVLWAIWIKYSIFSIIVLGIFMGLFGVLTIILFFKIKFPKHNNRILKKIFEIANGWNLIKDDYRLVWTAIFVILGQIIISVATGILLYKGINVHLSFIQALFMTTIGMVAGLASITPGNLGIAESVSVLSALVLGITPAQSLSAAILNRVVQLAVLFVLGPIFSYILIRKSSTKKK